MFYDGIIHSGILYLVLGCTWAQITHPMSWKVARAGRTARIECVVGDQIELASTPIHWYQHKTDAFRRVLYIPAGKSDGVNDNDFPKRFKGYLNGRRSILTITQAQMDDAAVYYCAYYAGHGDDVKRSLTQKVREAKKSTFMTPSYRTLEVGYCYCFPKSIWTNSGRQGSCTVGNVKYFSSGTKLFVSETGQTKPPTLIAFPPSKPQDGQTTLLCIAKGMYPDVVKFKWKEEDKEVPVGEKRIMEQKIDDGRASMLIIDERTVEKSHTCIVVHEENTKENKILIPTGSRTGGERSRRKRSPDSTVRVTTCNSTESNQTVPDGIKDDFELSRSLYLASLTYTLMILKSTAYFGFASLVLFKRYTDRSRK